MLIEIHILQNYSPSNLNRDDTGSPKEAVFGGYKRARISSQSLKRSIRRSDLFRTAVQDQVGRRTRALPELVRENLRARGLSSEMCEVAAKKATGFGTEAGKESEANASGQYRTAQTMFLSDADVAAVADVLNDAATKASSPEKFAKETAKDLQKRAEDKGYRPVPVDIALFGRMVTSEAFLDIEACSQFAHAISTHKVEHEFDYYTAVDDIERKEDDAAGSGADMIGDTEFNSACYYKYFNVHVEALLKNLDPGKQNEPVARTVGAGAVRALVEAAVRVSPSGKQNSFAAFQLPSVVLVEVRPDNLPISYANAFVEPVTTHRSGLVSGSAQKLKSEVETLHKVYGLSASHRFLLSTDSSFEIAGVERVDSLPTLLDQIEAIITNE